MPPASRLPAGSGGFHFRQAEPHFIIPPPDIQKLRLGTPRFSKTGRTGGRAGQVHRVGSDRIPISSLPWDPARAAKALAR
jgi:hypothetical protein